MLQHAFPLFVLHKHHQVVATYARIVHQHVDILVGMALLPLLHSLLYGVGLRHIKAQQLGLSAFCNNLIAVLLCSSVVVLGS